MFTYHQSAEQMQRIRSQAEKANSRFGFSLLITTFLFHMRCVSQLFEQEVYNVSAVLRHMHACYTETFKFQTRFTQKLTRGG